MQLKAKPELLAPAGTLEAVESVLDAGADAVYVGGKQLNMRQHRQSYNLTDEDIAKAILYAHENGKKLYFTLNSLVRDSHGDCRNIFIRLVFYLYNHSIEPICPFFFKVPADFYEVNRFLVLVLIHTNTPAS